MDFIDLVEGFVNLHGATKVVLSAIPCSIAIAAWLRQRIQHQRTYLSFIHRLSKFGQYQASRKAALRVLDTPLQFRFEEVERKIAIELKLNLRPEMAGIASYLNPADRSYLMQANRQLSSAAFRDFANDLLQRLILLLDDLMDLENHRKGYRWAADTEAHSKRRDQLRQRLAEDHREIEQHIQLMQRYLAGRLDLDLYSEKESHFVRSLLEEKYKALASLSVEDECL